MNQEPSPDFEALLEYMKRSRGFDFTAYKRSSLMRRIDKRLQALRLTSYGDYMDYLEVHPEEFAQAFNSILINVTGFFRDASAWEYLAGEIVPRIVQAKGPHGPIRVWSAGCASGEEAYTVAIVLAEALGIEGFKERVKIYATDMDDDALNQARQACYGERQVAEVPAELLEKYFEPNSDRHCFHKELRRAVIFGRHDLIQDAPISRLSLIVCRNTLMYLNSETQARILERFQFALENGGYLFLGKAETLLTHTKHFAPVDLKRRVFSKIASGPALRERVLIPAAEGRPPPAGLAHLKEMAFEVDSVAQVVVGADGALALANDRARAMFGMPAADVGRPFSELELSYRPIELRSLIERVITDRCPVSLKEVEWHNPAGEQVFLDMMMIPLVETTGELLGMKISFREVTAHRRLQEELRRANHELETTSEELQSSNEELETTNEELGSTIEELETTNEELQSTNEELETMNEELQSTNEELETANEELQQRGRELDRINLFLNHILASLREGVVVIDRDLRVQAWNHRAEDLWGVQAPETLGKHFLGLDIGLPVEQLKQPLHECLGGRPARLTLEATNRRGKAIEVQVSCTPLVGTRQDIQGGIMLMEELGG